jgi:N-acetyl-gamma-glutamyl-phosphate reductase
MASGARSRVAVVGATGYAGAELVRLLAQHPLVELASVHARERDDVELASELPHLAPLGLRLRADGPAPGDADVVFLALPAGASSERAAELVDGGATVIDIGPDFRLRDEATHRGWYGDAPRPAALAGQAIYGLTELARDRLPGAQLIANPGCYPTAALLALAPFATAGLLAGEVIVDAKSGVSGAGRTAAKAYGFSELEGSVSAYGLGGHRHLPEIEQGLAAAAFPGTATAGAPVARAAVTFVPHLVPMARGLLATCYLRLADDLDGTALRAFLCDAYPDEPFVHVLEAPPATKLAAGSNHAFLFAERTAPGRAVVTCAIDNLGKGAAGQAVQNMNVALRLPETAGLGALGVYP